MDMVKFTSEHNSNYTTYLYNSVCIGGVTLICFLIMYVFTIIKTQLMHNFELIDKIQLDNKIFQENIIKKINKQYEEYLKNTKNMEELFVILQNEIKELELELTNQTESHNKVSIRIEGIEVDLSTHNQNHDKMQNVIESIKMDVSTFGGVNTQTQNKIKKLRDELSENIEKISNTIMGIQVDLARQTENHDKMRNEIESIKIEVSTIGEVNNKTNNTIKEVRNELSENIENFNKDTCIKINSLSVSQTQMQEEIRINMKNMCSGFTIIPHGSGFCNLNVEEILFYLHKPHPDGNKCSTSNPLDIRIYEGNSYNTNIPMNIIVNSMYLYLSHEQNSIHVRNFIKQFKNIKNVHFDIGFTTDSHYIGKKLEIQRIMALLFHDITETNPLLHIYYKCKDMSINHGNLTILNEFTKTTNYKLFHLEIENNFIKDNTTGNMKHVSSTISNNIKEHCVNNNIRFVSNIGL